MKLRNPSALESHLGFWLRFVSNHVSARFEGLLAGRGVSVTEWVAMRSLFDHEDASAATLIDALGMTKGAASKVIAKLEAKGLLTRSQGRAPVRGQVLRLSEAGERLLPELAALADANDEHFFAHFTEVERQNLRTLMQKLVAHQRLTQFPLG